MNPFLTQHLPEISRILKEHEVVSAYVFGSAVSSHFNETSDVDLLVRFKPGLDPVNYGEHYIEALISLQNLLKRDVDLVAEETLSNPILIQSINRSKLLIYE